MSRYGMEGVDLKRLQIAHRFLSQVVDRLVNLDDFEPELEFEPTPDRVELDGLTSNHNYYPEDDCCEGMKW